MKTTQMITLTSRKAFSLVEAMVGMGIFILMSMGLGGSLIYSLKISEMNMAEFVARTAAQSYLEQLRVIDYASLLRSSKDPFPDLPTMEVDLTPANITASLESSPLKVNSWVSKDLPMVTNPTGEGNNRSVQNILPAKFFVETLNRNTGSSPYQAIEIRVSVQWLPPKVSDWTQARTATFATVRSSVP